MEFASIKILRKTEVLRIVEHVQYIIVRIVLKLHTILAIYKAECQNDTKTIPGGLYGNLKTALLSYSTSRQNKKPIIYKGDIQCGEYKKVY